MSYGVKGKAGKVVGVGSVSAKVAAAVTEEALEGIVGPIISVVLFQYIVVSEIRIRRSGLGMVASQ